MAKLDKKPGKEVAASGPQDFVQAEIVAPRCKVCNSPYRREIDMCLATGWSQAAVIKHFNQLNDIPFNKANMSVHASKHLRSSNAALRRIWETRAREIGLDTESIENFITTIEGARDIIVLRGVEQAQDGNLKIEARDVLQALKDKEQAMKSQEGIAIEVLQTQFREFVLAIKDSVSPGEYETIYKNFEGRMHRLDIRDGRVNPPLQLETPTIDEELDVQVDYEVEGEAEEVTE